MRHLSSIGVTRGIILPVLTGLICFSIGLFDIKAAASEAPEAEAYVQQLADQVTSVLGDQSLSTDDKAAQLRNMIDEYLDVRRIAYFALGRYRRDATAQGVLDDYIDAFKEYSISLYESRLTEYGGESLRVTGSEDRNGKGTDLIVKSVIEGNGEPLDINWRVIKTDSGLSIVDAQLEGIWLALDLREQFASIITNNGGSVQALIDHLRTRA